MREHLEKLSGIRGFQTNGLVANNHNAENQHKDGNCEEREHSTVLEVSKREHLSEFYSPADGFYIVQFC